jgi:hypothetical protein
MIPKMIKALVRPREKRFSGVGLLEPTFLSSDAQTLDLNPGEPTMTYHDKIQLTFIIIAPPDQVEEGDRLFRNHGSWMEATHHRSGEKALLSYNVSKGPEISNPMDLDSATDNTCFVLSEIYESKAGVLDHFQQSNENWGEFQAFREWLEKCKVTFVPAASIFNSLW